jgi:hypothetical protein
MPDESRYYSSSLHIQLFRHTSAQKLDAILWKDALGGAPASAMLKERQQKFAKEDGG